MNHNRTYIEELIRKQLLEQLTAEEAAALELEKAGYSEEEYDAMVVEVLWQLEGQLPEGFLKDWEPDYAVITAVGDRMRAKRTRQAWQSVVQSAALLVVILGMIAYFFVSRSTDRDILRFEGDCIQLAGNVDIPASESACTIYLGDSTVIGITADQVGEICVVGDLRISRTEEGVLRLDRESRVAHGSTKGNADPLIMTAARQQCVVRLENGTSVRLNAQSYIRYPLQWKDTLKMEFGGEALVEGRDASGKSILQMKTQHGWLTAEQADFVVASSDNEMKAVLDRGVVNIHRDSRRKPLVLSCYEHFGAIRQVYNAKGIPVRDTLVFAERIDIEMVKTWTKAMRTYKNIPLRMFVAEVSRWEGFTIKDWRCIPEDKVVTATICYRNDREQVFAAIRNTGVQLWVKEQMLSFCPEDTKKWGGLGGTSGQLAYR